MEANMSINNAVQLGNPGAPVSVKPDSMKKPDKLIRSPNLMPEQKQSAFNTFMYQQRTNRLINMRQRYI